MPKHKIKTRNIYTCIGGVWKSFFFSFSLLACFMFLVEVFLQLITKMVDPELIKYICIVFDEWQNGTNEIEGKGKKAKEQKNYIYMTSEITLVHITRFIIVGNNFIFVVRWTFWRGCDCFPSFLFFLGESVKVANRL